MAIQAISKHSTQGGTQDRAHSQENDNQPDYRVFHVTDHFKSDIGAAWKKNTRDGAQYLSVSIDDPGQPDKIFCRLIKRAPSMDTLSTGNARVLGTNRNSAYRGGFTAALPLDQSFQKGL